MCARSAMLIPRLPFGAYILPVFLFIAEEDEPAVCIYKVRNIAGSGEKSSERLDMRLPDASRMGPGNLICGIVIDFASAENGSRCNDVSFFSIFIYFEVVVMILEIL